MKHLLFFGFLISLFSQSIEAQTNANIAGPENVLLVWNSNVSSSDSVKDYYKNVRNIPTSNILDLALPNSVPITVDGSTHNVIIAEGGNIIRDSLGHEWGSWFVTQHAWKYYYQYVAEPIKEHLINNNLTSTIRYIVLCKGVPFKIQAGGDHSYVIGNLAVDGLLCMLNTNNYDILLDSIYNKFRRYALPDPYYDSGYYNCMLEITNPYYSNNSSSNLNMNNRFKGGVFTRNWNGHTIKLDYLVSHLDGINYNMVKDIIDRSTDAIHSSNYDWFIDADPIPCRGGNIMVSFANSTASTLNSIGFSNYFFDTTEDTFTYHNKPVMSYSSNGIHTTLGPYYYPNCYNPAFPPDYIQSSLNFNYLPGAIFNTAESFNAHLLGSIARRPGAEMGQVVEFFLKGGTVGVGHAWEPFTYGIIRDGVMLPAYQVGYSFIDAAYLGMQYLAWQNVIVGDPLTTIAWGKQTLTQDVIMSNTNLVTGLVTVPLNNTITLDANALLRFKHNGFINGDGSIITDGKSFEFQIEDWDRSVFRSSEDNHPKIIWGEYPVASPTVEGYNIYRKWDQSYFSLIGSTDESTFDFIDQDVEIYVPTGENPKNAEYYVKAILYVGPGTVESEPSNTIDYWVDKASKIKSGAKVEELVYELEQNYPNPFNPVTTINYQIPNDGIVTLKVCDILGKEVATLVNSNQVSGKYSVLFDASSLSSGVYIYQITTPGFIQARKMILTK